MPNSNPITPTVTATLTPSEWEAVQLMRTRPAPASEMIYVPRAAYELLETTALNTITAAKKAKKLAEKLDYDASILDYLVGQMRTV